MKIKVMTYNLPYWSGMPEPKCFNSVRREHIKEFLLREMPDIIGFQEMQDAAKTWLSDNMPDYVFLGMGREVNYNGESVAIAYNKRKFDLYSFDQFWLSPTPDVPASCYKLDQSEFPRIAVVAKLVSKEDKKPFVFANTHLDHIGNIARVCGADLIMSKISAEKLPFILTGDFNELPTGDAIKEVTSVSGVSDLTSEVVGNTFRDANYCKIDYIFSSGTAVPGTLTVHKDEQDGVLLSDHYPVSVVAEI